MELNLIETQTYLQTKIDNEFVEWFKTNKETYHLSRNGYVKRIYEGVELKLPRVRANIYNIQFHPSFINKRERFNQLTRDNIIADYAGMSQTKIVKKLNDKGIKISRASVSRIITKHTNEVLKSKQKRDLEGKYFDCLFIDGTWEKVGNNYCVVVIVVGYTKERKEIIFMDVFDRETKAAYNTINDNLIERGLEVPELWVSDRSEGLVWFMKEHPEYKMQRCVVHFMRDLCKRMKVNKLKKKLTKELQDVFYNSDAEKIKTKVSEFIDNHYKDCKETCDLLKDHYHECLVFCDYDNQILPHRVIKTTNPIESFNSRFKRRTKSIRVFMNTRAVKNIYTLMCFN